MNMKLKHEFYNDSELIMVFYGTLEQSLDLSSRFELLGIEYTHCTTEVIK